MDINGDYILEILKQGSFTKAAEALFISQPSLSRYVIRLEERLGTPLFDRSSYPVTLTAAGQAVVKYIQKSRKLEENLLREIHEAKREVSGIRVGIVTWRTPVFLPRIVPGFRAAHPNIDVVVSEGVSRRLEEQVIEGKIDICVMNGPLENASLEYRTLHHEKIFLLAPANSQFAQNTSAIADIAELEEETFVVLPKEFRLGAIARQIFQYHKFNPRYIVEASNMHTMIGMTCAGMGFCFIPDSAAEQDFECAVPPVRVSIGKPDFSFPLLIAYRKERYCDAVKQFVDFVSDRYAAYLRSPNRTEARQ